MLTTTRHLNKMSVNRLVQFWAGRYVPDLSTLSSQGGSAVLQLVEVASPEGRAKTVAKLQRLLQNDCELAGIQTNDLFSYIPNIINLAEAKRLARCVWHIYEKALEVYQLQSSPSTLTAMPLLEASGSIGGAVNSSAVTKWAVPVLEQLVLRLEPLLQQLRQRYILSIDSRTLGFMTTQFHFSTSLVLKHVTLPEQVLLMPYFRFIEEQVCIPLQRVCEAAKGHHLNSPTLALVEQLLPASHEIAKTVYSRAAKLYPNHLSRRGKLSHPGVMTSTIRDLEMFQGYLWLCVLEGNMAAVKEELLPLCVMVFPSVQVTWELVSQMLQLMANELLSRVEPDGVRLLLPYTQEMQQLFSKVEKTVA